MEAACDIRCYGWIFNTWAIDNASQCLIVGRWEEWQTLKNPTWTQDSLKNVMIYSIHLILHNFG